MAMRFRNRQQAGRLLAAELERLQAVERWADLIVLALPRGGVPVAAEIARALDVPLDVLVTRKIGAPGEPEMGIGAIAGEDPPLFDRRALKILDLTPGELTAEIARERTELHRRESLYRQGRPQLALRGRTVVLVDDGLATGVTARAALRRVRSEGPARLILAVPVCDTRAGDELQEEADEFICLQPRRYLHAVGVWYEDFRQISDREVTDMLERGPRDPRTRTESTMTQQIREIMTERLVTVGEQTSVHDAATRMRDAAVGDVLVTDDGHLRGVVTDRDLVVRALAEGKDPDDTTVGEICSEELVSVGPDDNIDRAIDLMRSHALRRLPVLDDDRTVGIVSIGDLAIERDQRSALADISAAEPNT